jgi:hypothetical protein
MDTNNCGCESDLNILNNSNTDTIDNSVNTQVASITPTTINSINNVDYITLEIMANSDTYNKYLKKNNLDRDSVLKKEKRFYRKRIISMTKDLLLNSVSSANDVKTDESSKVDDVIVNAFNTYARLCISYFKFKDTMDTIQGEYKDMNVDTNIVANGNGNGNADDINVSINSIENDDNLNEANKLFMKQIDKKVLTLDNFVIKTSPPKEEMVIPQTKDYNLNDPKFKKKDIKKFGSTNSKLNKESKKTKDSHVHHEDKVSTKNNNMDNIIINKKSKSDIEMLLDKI